MKPWLKPLLEIGPVVVFFFTNARFGLTVGTASLMAATILSLIVMWVLARKIAVMPLVTAIFVMIFGGLTLYFDDAIFIKLKPTIVNTLFALIIFTSIALKRNLLPTLLGSVLRVSEEGWRVLAWRWGGYFLFLAALNEVVWRTQTTEFWIAFKIFGTLPITVLFALWQWPLLKKHQVPNPENP